MIESIESNGNNYLTKKEAIELINNERQERVEECRNEVQKVLDKYRCAFDVSILLKFNAVTPMINIISKE